MSGRSTTIELFKEEMKFSAGHFTIFSATERENLHGHNFMVYVALTGPVQSNGLFADYGPIKRKIIELCREWNEVFLLPSNSQFLNITKDDDYVFAEFNGEKIPFLERDILLLPIENTTLEEMSYLFCQNLLESQLDLSGVDAIKVKIASGPGQFGIYNWQKS